MEDIIDITDVEYIPYCDASQLGYEIEREMIEDEILAIIRDISLSLLTG